MWLNLVCLSIRIMRLEKLVAAYYEDGMSFLWVREREKERIFFPDADYQALKCSYIYSHTIQSFVGCCAHRIKYKEKRVSCVK